MSDGQLRFAIQAIGARYAGTWSRTDERWSGTWTQGGEIPLDLERGLPPKREVVEGLDGRWEGTVTRNGLDLRLFLDVNTGDLGTVVTLDSPDLAAMNIPVTEFTRTANRVTFTVPATGVTFEGTLSEEGDELTGPWRMPGRPDATITFVRAPGGQLPRRERPQTPGKSVPYDVENVRFENPRAAGVTLAGTLTLPRGAGPFPAAVLISGSGPQDRDQTVWGHKTPPWTFSAASTSALETIGSAREFTVLDGYWGERAEVVPDESLTWSESIWGEASDHDHCRVCWAKISFEENAVHYSAGPDLRACVACYTSHVQPRSTDFRELGGPGA